MIATIPRTLCIGVHFPSYPDYLDALLTEHGRWPVNSDDPITISCAVRVAAAALEEARREG